MNGLLLLALLLCSASYRARSLNLSQLSNCFTLYHSVSCQPITITILTLSRCAVFTTQNCVTSKLISGCRGPYWHSPVLQQDLQWKGEVSAGTGGQAEVKLKVIGQGALRLG